MARLIARAYLVMVAVLAAWVWYIDFSMRNSPTEHLLPDLVFSIATYPTSAAALHAAQSAPVSLIDKWYFGPGLLTLSAALQVAALLLLARFETRFFNKVAARRAGKRSEV